MPALAGHATCKSSIVSQAKVNLHNNSCGNGCHLTEECWLRYGPGEIILLFAGSVKIVMMCATYVETGVARIMYRV